MEKRAYPLIADHGLIGDLQTSALVGLDGTIDWFCTPRFDSPSIFASILDAEKGGHFQLTVEADHVVTKQLYFVDTAILMTRYLTNEGVGEVIDFMPVNDPHEASDTHRIVRIARVVRGKATFKLECAPRFNYGQDEHHLTLQDHHALFQTADSEASLHTAKMLDHSDGKELKNGVARQEFTLHQGEVTGTILSTGPVGTTAGALTVKQVISLLEQTIRYWRDWISRNTYRGRWRSTVARSAITLKLLTYAPTGALVAAPTAGLPEQIGGPRNWDYRYTWIRDGSFSVAALMELGYNEEAAGFLTWLSHRVWYGNQHEGSMPVAGPLQLMYRIDGDADLPESELDHLEGYLQSAPVRIGNGAFDQLQLDIYGEAIDAIYNFVKRGRSMYVDTWEAICKTLKWLDKNWDRPDEGIWETRGGQKNFVYSRLMCWVAFDRALKISRDRSLPGPISRWRKTRDKIFHQIMERGYNHEIGAFVQHYDSTVLDASILKMPLVGFISPKDPRWLSTLEAIGREIVSDSLVFRYNPEASPDGLAGDEGTFSLCTFWYVEALALAGRVAEARIVFEQMLTYANHLGLYSEEIGFTGEQLGNFPQAFTHLALISAAVTLNHALDTEHVSYESLIKPLSRMTGTGVATT